MPKAEVKTVKAKVDGIHLNASHYAAMDEEKGTAAIMADHKDHEVDATEEWATGAYAACVKAVQDEKEKK